MFRLFVDLGSSLNEVPFLGTQYSTGTFRKRSL